MYMYVVHTHFLILIAKTAEEQWHLLTTSTVITQILASKNHFLNSLKVQQVQDPVLSLHSLGHCCGMGLTAGPGTSTCCGCDQKEKKKKHFLLNVTSVPKRYGCFQTVLGQAKYKRGLEHALPEKKWRVQGIMGTCYKNKGASLKGYTQR